MKPQFYTYRIKMGTRNWPNSARKATDEIPEPIFISPLWLGEKARDGRTASLLDEVWKTLGPTPGMELKSFGLCALGNGRRDSVLSSPPLKTFQFRRGLRRRSMSKVKSWKCVDEISPKPGMTRPKVCLPRYAV